MGVAEGHSATLAHFQCTGSSEAGGGRDTRKRIEVKGAAGRTGCRQDRAVIAFCFRHDRESSKKRARTGEGGGVLESDLALPQGTSDAEP